VTLLQSLIDAAATLIGDNYDHTADNAERVAAVRAALTQARADGTDIDLAELESDASAEFERVRSGAANSPAALASLGAIVDVVDAVRAEQGDHDAALAAMDEMAGRIAPRDTDPADDPEGGTGDDPADDVTGDDPDDDGGTGTDPADSGALEPVLTAAGTRSPARTQPRNVSTGPRNARVPLGQMPNDVPARHRKPTQYALTAAADIPNVRMGSDLKDMQGLTRAVSARLQALSRAGKDTSAGIAVLERKPTDERLVVTGTDASEAIAYACDETQLPGGSLVAAAGWCAPAEQTYDFCDAAVVDGILEVPSVTARRGSLSWPESPDFSSIYTNTGFYFSATELEKPETGVGARADKPCYLIPCPGLRSLELDAMGLCLQAGILTERAYPELIEYFMAQALAAHAHKVNAVILKQIEALTTAVTLPGVTPASVGPGATATTLAFMELQAEYLRYRHRLGINATIEAVAPVFLRGILRSDLSKRMGVDMLTVTDAQLDAHLRGRNISPQWVLDWQDAFSGAATAVPAGNGLPVYDAAGFGGDTPPLRWPGTVKVMMWPAGTFFVGRNDLLQIDGLYDSALLKRNMHLALFTEEGLAVGSRGCYQALTITLPLCPDGTTGGGVVISCTNGAI
jgi:hypothetical protein